MKKLGFIGAGNMAGALIKGIIGSKKYAAAEILLSDPSKDKLDALNKEYGIASAANNNDLVNACETVIIAVKPQVAAAALQNLEIKGKMPLFISIMAGISTYSLEAMLPEQARVVRVMPNTPALIQKGTSAICAGDCATDADMKLAEGIFACAGSVHVVNEAQMDAIGAISGCGPAYFFLILEALSDAGVKMGLPRALALELAATTAVGAAKMVSELKMHPAALKDMVTSPGGTTIEALSVLESYGVRAAFIAAVEAATMKSQELG